MAVSFKSNNFDFPPVFFFTVSRPVSSVPASLSFATTCRSSSYVSARPHKSLSGLTNVSVMVLFVEVMSILVNLFVIVKLCV